MMAAARRKAAFRANPTESRDPNTHTLTHTRTHASRRITLKREREGGGGGKGGRRQKRGEEEEDGGGLTRRGKRGERESARRSDERRGKKETRSRSSSSRFWLEKDERALIGGRGQKRAQSGIGPEENTEIGKHSRSKTLAQRSRVDICICTIPTVGI